ncbi:Hpt domain-containing protein [Marinobacterium lutimaris]|uniref:HPt (Histidine-containing phosphotransfer) domain-containing protein n=1 Tax=Marinobacterium lutimaris TaxID=568106 RepID=A0A1H6DKI2_9GAMM|nr:Hpt domain-containing protein [Marinobacterium lutimaris]SEG85840.1 HPt (histidine-containing phosphotransfer) domain-containing protein [Marinobacterium lutimaris]
MSQTLYYDWTQALELTGGDEELLVSVLEMFLEEAPDHMAAMQRSHAAGDTAELSAAAHTLKGLLGTFGAESTVQLALEVEQGARRAEDVRPALSQLESRMKVLLEQLRRHCA